MTKTHHLLHLAIGVFICCGHCAQAVINVGLQPYDLFQSRYKQVVILTINTVDSQAGIVQCRVTESLKGQMAVGQPIELHFTGDMSGMVARYAEEGDFKPGQPIVCLAGRTRRTKDLMVYANGFYLGQMTDPEHWELNESSQAMTGVDGQAINTLAGTWNGSTEQLARMVRDIAAGRDFFPRKAYARFAADRLLDDLDKPVTGIGVYDLEGDGDLDIVACSLSGDQIYLQVKPNEFANATDAMGIQSRSRTCSLADMNGDGLTDMLLDQILYMGRFADRRFQFSRAGPLPFKSDKPLKSAQWVELNGDGYPDVLVSLCGGGLRVFQNGMPERQGFNETTRAMGLDRDDCGAGQDGYVTVGDWNGDGRCDLFYAAGRGFLMKQTAQGQFQAIPHSVAFTFNSGPLGRPGQTGAGAFLPLFQPETMDLVVPLEDGWLIVANQQGLPVDVTEWGNEISEGSQAHLATIGADLNLDGYWDFYTISNSDNGHNRFIVNRGYGSFMLASVHKHFESMFNGPAHQRGGQAVACGDLNDDGAPDLVLGNAQGQIVIISNDTRATRNPIEHPPHEIAILEQVRLFKVRVLGSKGVTQAAVRLYTEDGRLVARCDIGLVGGSGSCGPQEALFALRACDTPHRVQVRYADGLERTVDLPKTVEPYTTLNVDRGEGGNDVW
ncbi:MAG: VCBS repeat-containing protein [Phycisphaerae bacterium]|nr:VCBS repeat-containing protein [Phycisphaerae bacterium]